MKENRTWFAVKIPSLSTSEKASQAVSKASKAPMSCRPFEPKICLNIVFLNGWVTKDSK